MAVGLGLATTAVAQDDDWEYQEDAARQIWVAAARYDAGQMIVVQCRQGGLTAVLTGLPASEAPLSLRATRADGRASSQTWQPAGAPGAFRSESPGRDVRFMKGGGQYVLRGGEGASAVRVGFDLPTQSANLDRVLTACGWATEDDRDALALASISLIDPDDIPSRPRAPRSTRQAPRATTPRPEAPLTPPPAEDAVSCIVRDMHLRDCRADHAASARERDVLQMIRFHEGNEVYPLGGSSAADNEGKVAHINGMRVIVEFTTLPR
ncbi:hypothetical protein [Brevundimonas sp.]|uniref:hypothetical protein n=1 Tax=Brevundimonas sp. TaxID=1871086 RepID=UPI003F72418C